ncbi:speckle-type POZ protein A [Caerostris extrusa]|uniref:Speckle-type POZ protein A n=1 Tax=Caerostris extrusa TaxID=172846 RepID=A0AAV4TQP6_CAEEX|nr:speckle-type POZ protein A [Caerostris extrusa]
MVTFDYGTAMQQRIAVNSFLNNNKERTFLDVPYIMETLSVAEAENVAKSGKLTKKDILRWSVDTVRFRAGDCMIRSDFFKFGPCPEAKFYLMAHSNAVNTFFTVGLCRISSGDETESSLSIKVAFSLLDTRDRCHHTCERILKEADAVHASFDRNCYTNHHLTFLRDGGKIIIHCSMDVDEVLSEDTPEVVPKRQNRMVNLSQDLADDLSSLLQKELHTDMTLCVGEHKFQAHRAILAARSPVFAKMFEHDTLEKMNGCIIVQDLTVEAMTQLLRFLYTGETEELKTQELLALFVAADKYDLPKLKKNCSISLCSRVTSDIALNVLVVANLHSDEDLKEAAIQTVLENAIDVMKSEEWLTFLREYPEVANSIILSLAMKTVKTKETKKKSNS